MGIIFQTDARSGITYAYQNEAKWDPVRKMSRAKRTLIGRLDEATGTIVPTDGRGKNRNDAACVAVRKPGPIPSTSLRHMFFGATYLLESFSEQLGLTADLRACFPDCYKQILSIAFYQILEDSAPLYRFEKWHLTHKHPYGKDIASPRSSELFSLIQDPQIAQFFRLQAKRRLEDEYWAYDSTSFSSYSETLRQVQYGKNKEDDRLPQLNLLLVFGEKSGLPFYYRKLAGNIPDSKTVKHLLEDLETLDIRKSKFVMDRGFYSEDNINGLYQEHIKFLIGVRISLSFVRKNLDTVYDDIRMPLNYDAGSGTYGYTVSTQWNYRQNRPYKGDVLQEKRRLYLHLYYSIEKSADDEAAFDKQIAEYYKELMEDKHQQAHQKEYDRYFDVRITPKRGVAVTPKDQAIRDARRYFGYFALMSNEKMDAATALHLYRMKDVVEKAFGNLKERLNMRRLLVSSERSLEGKIFVEFVALILLSHLNHKMQAADLYRDYSIGQLLDKLDVIECFEEPGRAVRIGKMLVKQMDIYTRLGVSPPGSL